MLSRLETMVLMATELPLDAVRRQIVSAIDIIIHLGKLSDKNRKVLEVSEIEGVNEGNIVVNKIFAFENFSLKSTGNLLKKDEKLNLYDMQGYF